MISWEEIGVVAAQPVRDINAVGQGGREARACQCRNLFYVSLISLGISFVGRPYLTLGIDSQQIVLRKILIPVMVY